MAQIMFNFIATVFNNHCSSNHNADFEVCQHPVCNLARQIEVYYGNRHVTIDRPIKGVDY